jgi:signal transduction histidine kinase
VRTQLLRQLDDVLDEVDAKLRIEQDQQQEQEQEQAQALDPRRAPLVEPPARQRAPSRGAAGAAGGALAGESANRRLAELSLRIGAERARAGVHPAESLDAAALIFEAGLPVVTNALRRGGRDDPDMGQLAALILNRTIMDRMVAAAATYVDYLLGKIHRSNHDERRRLARELHDIAAPAVAVGLQNLDLYGVYSKTDELKAAHHLAAARTSMLDALNVIRDLAAQSREAIGRSGLLAAVARYAETVSEPVQVTLRNTGDLDALPDTHREEVFLIVREAIRNAVDHGAPRHLTVTLDAGRGLLIVTITDDGDGFDLDTVIMTLDCVGLGSMRERAELLGGTVHVHSAPGAGTTITLTVPVPDQRVRALAHQEPGRSDFSPLLP